MNRCKREAKYSSCRFSCTFPLQKTAGLHAFSKGGPLPPCLQPSPFCFSPLPLSISPSPNPTLLLLLRCNVKAVAHMVTVLLWEAAAGYLSFLPECQQWHQQMEFLFSFSNEIKVIPQILAFHTTGWTTNAESSQYKPVTNEYWVTLVKHSL